MNGGEKESKKNESKMLEMYCSILLLHQISYLFILFPPPKPRLHKQPNLHLSPVNPECNK